MKTLKYWKILPQLLVKINLTIVISFSEIENFEKLAEKGDFWFPKSPIYQFIL